MVKKMTLVFILAFVLNWIWEIAHSALYLNYQGGLITSFILFRAALADAVIISVLFFIAGKLKSHRFLFIAAGGLTTAVIIELWALQIGRWEYDSLMPIIPIIKIGLTPAIQLAITGFVVGKAVSGTGRI